MELHDKANRKKELVRQISVLKQSLADSEKSWTESKLDGIPNTIADSIRRDISKKEAMLAHED